MGRSNAAKRTTQRSKRDRISQRVHDRVALAQVRRAVYAAERAEVGYRYNVIKPDHTRLIGFDLLRLEG